MRGLEDSANGRVLIGAFVLVVLVCVVTTTLPVLGVRRAFVRPADPILRLTALQQSWALFAPDPRRRKLDASVVLRYADGSTWTWRPPSGDPFVSAARDYRWRKWVESSFLVDDIGTETLTARWAARTAPRAGAVSATVVRRVAPVSPPGPERPSRWSEIRHTVDLGGAG